MSTTPCWLAEASSPLLDLSRTSQTLNTSSRELGLLLGACALVVVPILVWAVYFRKRRRRHRSDMALNPGQATYKPHRRRSRRREHRRRNPTLAETGGLPPVRQVAEASEPQAQV
jgi:hypothetical protein